MHVQLTFAEEPEERKEEDDKLTISGAAVVLDLDSESIRQN
jgi:hypothetical protein